MESLVNGSPVLAVPRSDPLPEPSARPMSAPGGEPRPALFSEGATQEFGQKECGARMSRPALRSCRGGARSGRGVEKRRACCGDHPDKAR